MIDASSLEVAYQQAAIVNRIAAFWLLGGVKAAVPVASYYAGNAGIFLKPFTLLILILKAFVFVSRKNT